MQPASAFGKRLCDNKESLKELLEWIDVADRLDILSKHWSSHTTPPSGSFFAQVAEYRDLCEPLEKALELHEKVSQLKKMISAIAGLAEPTWHKPEELRVLRGVIQATLLFETLNATKKKFENLERKVRASGYSSNVHPVVGQIRQAIGGRDKNLYKESYNLLRGLWRSRTELQHRHSLLEQLRSAAPELASDLVSSYSDSVWDERMANFTSAWNWARADGWLNKLNDPQTQDRLVRELDSCRTRIRFIIGNLAEAKAWRNCFRRLTEAERQHLLAWTKAVRRIGKGKGKHASRHRKAAREHMKECRSAIPAWIMPVYRVAESVRPGADAFDVVIVDEASQSGPEALFLYYMGKKIVVVGDDKQISPDYVGIPRDDVELLRQRYIADIPHNDAMGVDNSFFDQAEIRYGGRIRLREHFRCMPEIIQFSNNLCYRSEPLVPLKQYGSGRLSPVITPYHVPNGYQRGKSPRVVNPPEAEAIVTEIKKCCESSVYNGKSMGVISLLGHNQARLIERLLLEEIGPEEMERRNLVCGDSYAFQGDERDIMFISLVSAPTEGHRIGTLASQRDERRFNVAASRAKDQMWLFHSCTLNDLSPKCLRYNLLEYCLNPQVEQTALEDLDLDRLAQTARTADRNRMPPPAPFDSWFEVDVFLMITERGYRVIPQFEIAGYYIDLLVEGMKGRLAVECDGDEWHGLAQYEQDMARQRQLERCGLQFWRIRGSTFYRESEAALSGLWETLESLRIFPGSDEEQEEPHKSYDKEERGPDMSDETEDDKEEPESENRRQDSYEPPWLIEPLRTDRPMQDQFEEKLLAEPDDEEFDRQLEWLEKIIYLDAERKSLLKEMRLTGQTKESPSTLTRRTSKQRELFEDNRDDRSERLVKEDKTGKVKSVSQALLDLLPEGKRRCERCESTIEVTMGTDGLFLCCLSPECGMIIKIDSSLLTDQSKKSKEAKKTEGKTGQKTQRKKRKRKEATDREIRQIDPSSIVDPLPHILSHLLSPRELACKKCGEICQIFVGRYGPFLQCTDPDCKKRESVKQMALGKAFDTLQIPCRICGRPMKVARGPRGLFPGCSAYPQCKTPEPWVDLRNRLKEKEVRNQLGGISTKTQELD
jgi:very-short-patch-repair endonuclease